MTLHYLLAMFTFDLVLSQAVYPPHIGEGDISTARNKAATSCAKPSQETTTIITLAGAQEQDTSSMRSISTSSTIFAAFANSTSPGWGSVASGNASNFKSVFFPCLETVEHPLMPGSSLVAPQLDTTGLQSSTSTVPASVSATTSLTSSLDQEPSLCSALTPTLGPNIRSTMGLEPLPHLSTSEASTVSEDAILSSHIPGPISESSSSTAITPLATNPISQHPGSNLELTSSPSESVVSIPVLPSGIPGGTFAVSRSASSDPTSRNDHDETLLNDFFTRLAGSP